jgi:hypothetical protein
MSPGFSAEISGDWEEIPLAWYIAVTTRETFFPTAFFRAPLSHLPKENPILFLDGSCAFYTSSSVASFPFRYITPCWLARRVVVFSGPDWLLRSRQDPQTDGPSGSADTETLGNVAVSSVQPLRKKKKEI